MRNAARTLLIMTLLVAASAAGQQETPAAEPSITLPPGLAPREVYSVLTPVP